MMSPTTVQRIESVFVALFALAALISQGQAWWWPFALFLLFDVSMIGYFKNTTWGANLYNLGHTYLVPALLGAVYALIAASGNYIAWLVILACSWAFHIGVDRALGYGLKRSDSFQDTHLGPIGPAKKEPGVRGPTHECTSDDRRAATLAPVPLAPVCTQAPQEVTSTRLGVHPNGLKNLVD